ncbi:MAG: sugar ABC transporter ATP-binding protein [Firmicutes bacterium]|nr:sugar ABC transporter ATP-binding protein [Bacillota bacterium]
MVLGEVLLSMVDITKIFPGVKALDKVSLNVTPGEVHALVGENGAGKSTLVNIVSGVHQPDGGEMYFDGMRYAPTSPRKAQEQGIGFVHQETALCPHLSVAENVFLGRMPRSMSVLASFKQAREETGKLLGRFATQLDPITKVQDLSIANQQVVEIIKALSLDCRLLILDEPTSSLTELETENLFRIIKDLKQRGISVLYISHRLKEVFTVCDRITILRDGRYVKTLAVQDTTEDEVIRNMVGRSISTFYPEKIGQGQEEIIRVEGLTRGNTFRNVTFAVRKGEILGFAGLVGAGRSEVARAVCGIDGYDMGHIHLDRKAVQFESFHDAIQARIAYLTEDRKEEGLFLNMAIQPNVSVTSLESITENKLIHRQKERDLAKQSVNMLRIKASSLMQKVVNLSGGNQQKVMVAKWLAIDPMVLFMDEPTRGIDVGAKTEIHYLMRQLANRGVGVVLISSELPEIIGMCDRVVVMNEGLLTGELIGSDITEDNIMRLAATQRRETA